MLELKNISKTYQTKYEKVNALKNINIKFPSTGLVFILGKSGSGKSTLLNIISGKLKPSTGSLIYDNKEYSSKDWDIFSRSNISFIFQEFNLIENLTVKANLNVVLDLKNISNNSLMTDTLAKLNISSFENKLVKTLSGGEKARVGIARALLKNTAILIADEPTGNLDEAHSIEIFDILKAISKEKLVLVVSHDTKMASKYADKIIYLNNGEITDTKDINNVTLKALSIDNHNYKLSFKNKLKYAFLMLLDKKILFLLATFLISLIITGISLVLNFKNIDINAIHAHTLLENKKETITLFKDDTLTLYSANFNFIEQEEITSFLKDYNYTYAYNIYADNNFSFLKFLTTQSYTDYYELFELNDANYYLYLTMPSHFKYQIIGQKPSKSEILISNFAADYIMRFGIMTKKGEFYPKSYESILNQEILINGSYYSISGIYIVNEDLKLKNFLTEEEKEYIKENIYQIYISPEFFDYADILPNTFNYGTLTTKVNDKITIGNINTNLQANEIIIGYDVVDYLTNNKFYDEVSIFDFDKPDLINNYLTQNNLLNKEVTLTLSDTYNIFDNKTITYKLIIKGADTSTQFSQEIGNKYILPNNLIRKYIINEPSYSKIYNLLASNLFNDKIKYSTTYSDIFTKFSSILISSQNLVNSLLIILTILSILIYLIYYNLLSKSNEEFKNVLKNNGYLKKDLNSLSNYLSLIFSVISSLLTILFILILTKLINYYLSKSYGFILNMFLNKWPLYLFILIINLLINLVLNFIFTKSEQNI